MKAVHLRTEYLENPLGIDFEKPRFFWQAEGGTVQTAYEIICVRDGKVIWDSGKVSSASITHIPYAGEPLSSRDIVTWTVTLWDENDESGEKASASFELGLLKADDWKALWITGNYKADKKKRYPVDCFRKTISAEKTVKKARLYITSCGAYEARINGKKAGEFCLAPGSTDYRKRIQYQTIDVTDLLADKNALEIELADGWYRGNVGALSLSHAYGETTKLLFQLEILFSDGSSKTIISDENTDWSNDGPMRFADLKDGEVVDASLHPSYSGKARICREDVIPSASNNCIPKMKEDFHPELIMTPAGKKVLDFGQNIAGFLSFKVHGKRGQNIILRMGEMLDENGEFTQQNIQLKEPAGYVGKMKELFVISGKPELASRQLHMTPEQKIDFTCSGEEDTYCTKFAVFGFRYALVEADFPIQAENFEAIAVYSDMEETGDFSCSNPLINQLVKNTRWSMKSNFLDVPTDCPTRERLGWTGDAQVFFKTGAYFMNTAAFFRKWLSDMEDAQGRDGRLPAVFPYSRADMMYSVSGNSVGWADAAILIPVRFFEMYRDRDLLEKFYPMMRRYAEYMISHTGHKNRREAKTDSLNEFVYEKGFHLGEWLEPEEFQEKITTDTAGSATRMVHTEECTAYFHYSMKNMADAAELLGKAEDRTRYQRYADGAAKVYDRMFLTPPPDTDRQAKLVRPLALGLVPEEKKEAVAGRLQKAVTNRNFCIGTGFLSTPFVLPVLTESGHADLAYRMLECEKYPSWLAEVKTGATTVWESWEGDASRNHYSPGAVCEWLFSMVGGIRMNGERTFLIKPVPDGSLSFAHTAYNSIYGRVESDWKKNEDGFSFRIVIPSNTSAILETKTSHTPNGVCTLKIQ